MATLIDGLTIVQARLTTDAAQRIIDTASDAGPTYGIGYWAEWHPTKRNVIREHNDTPLAKDRGPWITLTISRLQDGCARALAAGVDLTEDRFDGPTADLVIQYAALHEQRYG